MADQLIGRAGVAGAGMKFDFLVGSPALRSVMDAAMTSASETVSSISKLIGGDRLTQVGAADAAFKLTDLWATQPGRAWGELHGSPGLGAKLAAEASARAREARSNLGIGAPGLGSYIAGSATPAWKALQPPLSDLAKSFLPAGPQSSVVSALTAGLSGKGLADLHLGSFAGLDVGSLPRFSLTDHLQNGKVPGFSNDEWPSWSKRLGASVFDGVTSAVHSQGLSSWIQTTHRAAMDALWRAPEQSIATMLQSFSVLADHGVAWGWQGLRTALRARRAVLRGDVAAVVRFLKEVLGFKRTPATLVDAASAVLLEEAAWLPGELEVDEDVCPRIRQLTIREHRNFRLIGETELCGRSVDSLDRKVKLSQDEPLGVSLVDVVPAPPLPAGVDDLSDPRLVWLISRLTERERKILRMKAQEGRTWADAAVSCGEAPKAGEDLRRKVKRLGRTAEGTVSVVSTRAVS
ncbi:hypothetical protein [Mycolicibacter icosiumassiliensis]|uniref:hypothetical protein n=1 Tax=Mycolicibacter icosiumassiliensis TaxID=1792835 RepID=UPI0012B696B9|nr:hypothetical protein [Mycolicibacter icosiumassiliensis]